MTLGDNEYCEWLDFMLLSSSLSLCEKRGKIACRKIKSTIRERTVSRGTDSQESSSPDDEFEFIESRSNRSIVGFCVRYTQNAKTAETTTLNPAILGCELPKKNSKILSFSIPTTRLFFGFCFVGFVEVFNQKKSVPRKTLCIFIIIINGTSMAVLFCS